MNNNVDLSKFDNSWYNPGRNAFIRAFWYCFNEIFFNSSFPFYAPKRLILRLFGANVGKGVVIRPHVYIKYPWKLKIGDNSWIGEEVRIDNLDEVIIGNNVCISQRSYLVCGNHDFSKTTFDLKVGKIILEDGVWVGACAVIGPDSYLKKNSILLLGSTFKGTTEESGIYKGNPAIFMRKRKLYN
jgi:putative colanic acid biosynthesis acetyltransferase WcaF